MKQAFVKLSLKQVRKQAYYGINFSQCVSAKFSGEEKNTVTVCSFLRVSRTGMWSLLPFLALRVYLSRSSWEKRVFEHCLPWDSFRAVPAGQPGKRASPATVTLGPQHGHSNGSQDPMLGACTFRSEAVWGN